MTTKCYQLTRLFSYVTTVRMENGRQMQVAFNGSQNMGMHGRFVTADPSVQRALEDSVAYRQGMFRVLYAEKEPKGKKEEPEEQTTGRNVQQELEL